ncbi:MAG: hypothetical protein H0W45_10625 [Acidobacteria bacterium]|nr:hypothetical protein [Acidobacteriota bacterium]
MCCKGFVKRIVPFFLTFAVGLFIASFFVTVAAPNFQISNRGWRRNHRQYDRQRELEIQRLQEENLRMKNQLSENDSQRFSASELKYNVPPPPPAAPNAVPYRNR